MTISRTAVRPCRDNTVNCDAILFFTVNEKVKTVHTSALAVEGDGNVAWLTGCRTQKTFNLQAKFSEHNLPDRKSTNYLQFGSCFFCSPCTLRKPVKHSGWW